MHEITGHRAVRQALRDVGQWSSDLQGDSDVRDYRQIPLEVDPPAHHAFRTALSPYFVRPRIESLDPAFARNARHLLDAFTRAGGGDLVHELALPYVVRCLGDVYGRPQDVAEWLSWGPDVWQVDHGQRSGARLHEYLDRVYREAGPSDDYWSFLATLRIEGAPLTEEQFRGIGSVSLAGGRDTVVKLFSGALWHLLTHPEDRDLLTDGSVPVRKAIQEWLRHLSPLPAMARVPPAQQHLSDAERDPEQFAQVSFVSANYDPDVFPDPDRVYLTRERIPHVAFGFGPHTCIGNHLAEIETEALLVEVLPDLPRWTIVGDPRIEWTTVNGFAFPQRIDEVRVRIKG